ncbi:hypothetical protein CHS0354_035049 [Potamilus streckersoni]|uniref:Uncharacterized protein n=1 Tax=Potamilus streckersoni TaxID=2493646 RepID=A0AAE0SA74_9BIVA|nr:hypothetical protein CHS0354_035049 [Potamilus streckersoni]
MAFLMVFLTYGVCVLFVPASLAISRDQQSSNGADLQAFQARLLSRLLEVEKQNIAAPEETVDVQNELAEERGKEKETVYKVEDKGNIIDISVGDQLIEQHIQDCEQRYEMILLNDDVLNVRPKACYLHKMEDKLYDFACKGKGERPYQTYYIGKEVVNKEIVPEDGPVSVCRNLPMFEIFPANGFDQANYPSVRELKTSKRCIVRCCSKVLGVCVKLCFC